MENNKNESKALDFDPNLETIFSKRSINEMYDTKTTPDEKQSVKTSEKDKTLKLKEKKSLTVSHEESHQDDQKDKSIDWKSEAERETKKYNETRKWGKEANEKLNSYKRKLKEYKELGYLDDETAQALLEVSTVPDEPDSIRPLHEKLAKTWDTEIQNIRKYGDSENLDTYNDALMHLLSVSSQDEIDDMFDDIKHLVDEDPVMFVKKSLEIGKEYYEDIYKDYSDAGNLKSFKNKYEEKLIESQKTIDKLEKEILNLRKKYDDDYDEKPQYNISQLGGDPGGGNQMSHLTKPGELIERMNRGQYRPKV